MPLRPGRKVIPVRWASDLKVNASKSVSPFKTRLIGRRYMQIEGVYFSETYFPVQKHGAVRLVVALMLPHGW